jgi:phosphoribosylformylglycinamidine cyclo-ligase
VAAIDTASWQMPEVFRWLQEAGGIADNEMYRTFNCGVGMIVCVPGESLQLALDTLHALGENAWQIGELRAAESADAEPTVTYEPGLTAS